MEITQMNRHFTLWIGALSVCASLSAQTADLPVCRRALQDKHFLYYTDFTRYPRAVEQLPVAVFDSGTGGFTVLEKILSIDCFNNNEHNGNSVTIQSNLYVHTLQHALRLVGLSEIADNFKI